MSDKYSKHWKSVENFTITNAQTGQRYGGSRLKYSSPEAYANAALRRGTHPMTQIKYLTFNWDMRISEAKALINQVSQKNGDDDSFTEVPNDC